MSRNANRKEVTKRAVLAELESLRQGRHARYQTLLGRFARCQELQRAATLCAAAVEANFHLNCGVLRSTVEPPGRTHRNR